MTDLSKLSLSELHTLDSDLSEAIKTRQYLDISKAREQILHIAQSAGLSVKDILSDKVKKRPKSAPVAAKYRNPDDANQTWSGRGRQPLWIKSWIAEGKIQSLIALH